MKIGTVEFELKDLLVGVPALGAAIAVTWEVGRFTACGGFRFFSLSEHILASLQALPIALAVAIIVTAGMASSAAPIAALRWSCDCALEACLRLDGV